MVCPASPTREAGLIHRGRLGYWLRGGNRAATPTLKRRSSDVTAEEVLGNIAMPLNAPGQRHTGPPLTGPPDRSRRVRPGPPAADQRYLRSGGLCGWLVWSAEVASVASSRPWAAMTASGPAVFAARPVLVSSCGFCSGMSHGKWCKGPLKGEKARPATRDTAAGAGGHWPRNCPSLAVRVTRYRWVPARCRVTSALRTMAPMFLGKLRRRSRCRLIHGPRWSGSVCATRRVTSFPAGTTADRTHRILGPLIPPSAKYDLHVALIEHGRTVCAAQRPRCSACVLRDLCPHATRSE